MPFYREFISVRNVMIVLACLVAILIATIIFINYPKADAAYAFSSVATPYYFFIAVLLNGGIGILVSLIISTIILRDQRFEVQLDLDRRIDAISKNVFAGALGMKLPKGYVDLAVSQILSPFLVRENLQVQITMKPVEKVEGLVGDRKFVLLQNKASWTNHNISSEEKTFPVGVRLPNPMLGPLIDLVTLRGIRVAGVPVADDKLRELNQIARQEAKARKSAELTMMLDPVKIGAGDRVPVEFDYDIVKEDEDNEIIQTSVPTESMNLKVRDQTGRQLIMMAKSIHSSEIEPASRAVIHDGWAEWTLSQWAFPRQGIVFWWKLPNREVTLDPEASNSVDADAAGHDPTERSLPEAPTAGGPQKTRWARWLKGL
ncbi:hypothetical protein [Sphingomonas sp. 3-13AW]|uniref:hypothetical protein n=1 Tax=Sphingomonas sp. 3-13AW TaxID=3050450 RepID=UPI003BB65E0C